MSPLTKLVATAVVCWPLVTWFVVDAFLYDEFEDAYRADPVLAASTTALLYAFVVGTTIGVAHRTWNLNATADDQA